MVSGNDPIKVCFVCPKVYPIFDSACAEVFGGAEVDLYNLGTELAKDPAFDVSFVAADYGQPAQMHAEGVTLIRGLDFKRGPLAGALKLWQAMKQADAEIYMLKTVSMGVPLVAWFCRHYGKAFVYRTASALESNGQYVHRHRTMGKLFLWSLKRADLIFTQNQVDCDNLMSTSHLRSVMVRNGHRLEAAQNGRRDSVLWVGRSDPVKGPQKFIELARRTPCERFVMICQRATGDASYGGLVQQAEEIGNLTFIERVPFHQTDAYFQAARVLVNTSDSEGFSNTFIQACRWAVPILSLNVNPDDFLNRWSCGICCHSDENRLAQGLRALLESDRYVEIGQNARKYAEANHDITKIVDVYKELFRKLV
ncbi:MAG: glycosyltransferase [Phycisphaerae bacterium]|nr:glycosyltransferase [Phycisphaerae bacterium]